ncbi:MAG TPA: 1-(5-phosphoribosyl)-5-[(5-phosphoribosylamino)methylideneamino] imidazole-4-carboxamide isomerase [Gemmatimonadaceae bacterium]|nr:1-(5-phosphoribosyl)-5-[(5-phosphoribosylamino)methylideneamino] imidazole-4-carboxamide isomerase [Gemmatimonadaceae bacterium]
MIAIPAVDLRDHACVQLAGGSYDHERLHFADPLGVARGWAQLGFRRLHLVDLDAATGHGSNAELVREILTYGEADVQAGGGVRSGDDIEWLLSEGAEQVMVGTRALEEPLWLEEMASLFPSQLIVACDVRDRRVVTRGWNRTLPRFALDVIEELNALPLAGVLVTAVHRDGQLSGTDLPLMEDAAESSEHPVLASGGVSTMNDLRALEERGVSGVIIGMALYTGALDVAAVAEEFAE